MRTSREFSSYNFRNYFVRRTKSVFQEIEVRLAASCHLSQVAYTLRTERDRSCKAVYVLQREDKGARCTEAQRHREPALWWTAACGGEAERAARAERQLIGELFAHCFVNRRSEERSVIACLCVIRLCSSVYH